MLPRREKGKVLSKRAIKTGIETGDKGAHHFFPGHPSRKQTMLAVKTDLEIGPGFLLPRMISYCKVTLNQFTFQTFSPFCFLGYLRLHTKYIVGKIEMCPNVKG